MAKKGEKKAAAPAKLGAPATAQEKLHAVGLDALCTAIVGGVSMTAYAHQCEVSIGSLINWIEGDVERSARVREARRQSAATWDDKALAVLEEATDAASVSRAREIASHLRWRASKIAPKEYGDKQEIDLTARVSLTPAEVEAKLAPLLAKAAK